MKRLALLSAVLMLGLALPAAAQTTGFGSAQNVKAPVEVTSDSLQVDQKTGVATFIGHVVVVQQNMRLAADRVIVTYDQGDRTRISTLHAEGNVTLTSGPDAAESRTADYDVKSGHVILRGDVLLTQGPNVLTGETVTVDLATGQATASGRVRSLLQPEGN